MSYDKISDVTLADVLKTRKAHSHEAVQMARELMERRASEQPFVQQGPEPEHIKLEADGTLSIGGYSFRSGFSSNHPWCVQIPGDSFAADNLLSFADSSGPPVWSNKIEPFVKRGRT